MDLCVGDELANPEQCGIMCWANINKTLYSVTHPSYTPNVRPTSTIFSCYVDVVHIGQVVVFLETDGRLIVVVINSQQDVVSLIISYTGNRSVSVHDGMWCTSRQ